MGYERYPRNTNPQEGYYGRSFDQDYGADYGSGSEYSYSSARDYESAGEIGPQRQRPARRYGYGGRDQYGRSQAREGGYADRPSYGYGNQGYREDRDYRRQTPRAAYGSDYDYEERGFMARAGDEVRSWFGDDEAEHRRELDQRHDARFSHPHDADYHHWRGQQIDALDRDYAEYRRENRDRFHNEFGSWRRERQGQRSALSQVAEHMEVVGSDGEHVGTVDKVRGDRIVLTKNDEDAGGRHHSIPSRWIDRVDDKVTIRKTATDAQAHWKDEERNQALFNEPGENPGGPAGNHMLNRSFSGTY